MHQGKTWIHTKKTSNILLIIIAAILLIILLSLINAYRKTQNAVVDAERFLTSKLRPIGQIVQQIENATGNAVNAVAQGARQVVSNVENAVNNAVNNPQLQNDVQLLLNQLLQKLGLLKSTKEIIGNKKLEKTYKKIEDRI